MQFGPVALDDAQGAVLAHSARLGDGVIRKGTVLGADEIERLRRAGWQEVVVARRETGDLDEDQAARSIAAVIGGDGARIDTAFTGRVNLFAEADGLFTVDRAAVDHLNRVDDRITVATLAPFARVVAGQMVATVKIIPYAVPGDIVERVLAAVDGPVLGVRPFAPLSAHLVVTTVPGEKPGLVEKRRRAVVDRVERLGGSVRDVAAVAHRAEAVAEALRNDAARDADMVLMFGGAAMSDAADVLPAGVTMAGGDVERVGMPVDPGNLTMIARLGGKPVIGVPSCAASAKLNGFDWVLERLFAGLDVSPAAVAGLGVGGLLNEIPARTQPRLGPKPTGDAAARPVAIVVLAAGRSSRMPGGFKLLEPLHDEPVIGHVCRHALTSRADDVIVVTGHRAAEVEAALAGTGVRFVHNAGWADGLASSLRAGMAAVTDAAAGVLVMLGDMPLVDDAVINDLIAAFTAAGGGMICVPVFDGKRGNPVLWPASFAEPLLSLQGDAGARSVIAGHADSVLEVAVESDGVLRDVDTWEALQALREVTLPSGS